MGTVSGQRTLHLHGWGREPAGIVLDTASYQRVVGDARVQAGLRVLAMSHTLVFFGHSLDPREAHLRRDVLWARTSFARAPRHLLVHRAGGLDAARTPHGWTASVRPASPPSPWTTRPAVTGSSATWPGSSVASPRSPPISTCHWLRQRGIPGMSAPCRGAHRRQRPFLDHSWGRGGRHPADPHAHSPATPPAGQAACRQDLRQPPLPRGAATPWGSPRGSPAWGEVKPAAGPPPLADRADDRLAAWLAAAAGPLRAL
jgi:hypothetical protein